MSGAFPYKSPSTSPTFTLPRSLAAILWPQVPVILGTVILEMGMPETNKGRTKAWVMNTAVGGEERGSTGMDMSLGRGGVLGVV